MPTPKFDPYQKWFGISVKQRPPSYYELLGVEIYESSVDVLEKAIGQRVEFLQAVSNGEHVADAQKVLNEVANARLCLLDSEKKRLYDQTLQVSNDSLQKPDRQSVNKKTIERPLSASTTQSTPSKRRGLREKPKSSNALIPAVGGALAAVVISVIVLYFMFGRNKDLSQKSDGILPESNLPTSVTIESSNKKSTSKKAETASSVSPNKSDGVERLSQKLELDAAGMSAAIPRQDLILWLDASDPESIVLGKNTSVVGWLDKSGNGFIMVQNRASNQPDLAASTKFHGQRILNFVAKEKMFFDMKRDSEFALKNSFSIVLVSHGSKGVLMSDGVPSNTSQNGFAIRESNSFRFLKVDGKYVDFFAVNDSPNDPNVRVLSFNQSQPEWHTEAGSIGEFRKGQRRVTLDPSIINLDVLNSDALRIGARPDQNRQYFEGEIAEILIYKRILTKQEISGLTSHLRSKWINN